MTGSSTWGAPRSDRPAGQPGRGRPRRRSTKRQGGQPSPTGRRWGRGRRGGPLGTVVLFWAGFPAVLCPHLGVASTWLVGGLRSGPVHLGRARTSGTLSRRPVIAPVVAGVAAFGAFYAAALIARRFPVLNEAVTSVFRFASRGSDPLVVFTSLANGVAEEVFFAARCSMRSASDKLCGVNRGVHAGRGHPKPRAGPRFGSHGNALRGPTRASGGVRAPILTHLTWSSLMLRFLPPLFRTSSGLPPRRPPGGDVESAEPCPRPRTGEESRPCAQGGG